MFYSHSHDYVCLTLNVSCWWQYYQAEVLSDNSTESYIGLTANEFKQRYNNHKTSFNNESKKNTTELSKHIWELKEGNKEFTIKWSIIAKAAPYNPATKRCNLCLAEKYFILLRPDLCSLNKRSELLSKCRHQNRYLLNAVT